MRQFLALVFLMLPLCAHAVAPENTPGPAGVTQEQAVSMAQAYCRNTGRDKYWLLEEPQIELRDKGQHAGKIWDISFPSKRKRSGDLGGEPAEPPIDTLVRMLPFLMWVVIESGDMFYNEFRAKNGKIYVIATPAKTHPE